MITKNQAIEVLNNYLIEVNDENEINICKELLSKIEGVSENDFSVIACRTLGKNADINEFNDWLNKKIHDHELYGTKFVELNNMISYNLAGNLKTTIALHVVPTKVSFEQIRNSGSYLVDALEQLRNMINDGEFENIETIFAVSDILKLGILQKYFNELGFKVEKADEIFRKKFKNPYQASLSKDGLMSVEWEKLKDKFMEDKLSVEEIENNEEIEK